MFRKILLPIDLTDKHGRAVDTAAGLAALGGGEVTLLHVVELIAGLPREDEPTFYERLEKKARAHLQRLADGLTARAVRARAEVVFGHRAGDIARYAGSSGADLVVLTSPAPHPDNPAAGLGSLSHRVGLLCSCPVLLVK